MADLTTCRWRVGRSLGRTVYAQIGAEPADDDVLIGLFDSRELAAEAVRAHNSMLEELRQRGGD